MPRSNIQIEIGNLVVKFGEHLNLVDLLEEVVMPAIFDSTLKRTYSDTSYLFYHPVYLEIENEPIIAGRLVKDTVLEREQLLKDGVLEEASGTLPSSPSSLFVLLLGCHRLLFVREHRGSPTMDNFRTTLSRFLKTCHRNFIKAKGEELDPETSERPSLRELVKKFPYPSVDLTPLGSQESIHSFIQKFQRIETVTANLLETNSELDNDGMFKSIRRSEKRMRSTKTTLRYENKKQGLNPTETEEQLTVLAKQGNHSMKVKGVDANGETLEGDNEKFKVKIPIADLPADLRGATKTLLQRFLALKNENIITVPDSNPAVIQRIKNLNVKSSHEPTKIKA